MWDSRTLDAALAVLRRSYLALSEVEELTGELSQAVDRQDQVSVRMFLSMRQEQINRLSEDRAQLRRQCGSLPDDQAGALWALVTGRTCSAPEGQAVFRQARNNRAVLERIIRADAAVSRRMGGKKSFYAAKSPAPKG